jgi:hypothetical protein
MVDDQTLHDYGIILRKLIYGVFASCDDHQSGYALPLSVDDRNRAADFKEELSKFAAKLEDMLPQDIDGILDDDGTDREKKANKLKVDIPDDLILSFHHFIKPFLYPRSADSHSRWDDPLECFIALFSLSQEGHFKGAEVMTQPFAHLFYLIRSAIFYEAYHQFTNNNPENLTLDE